MTTEDATTTESTRRFTILYATQTGTAEDVAERIARIARRRRFGVRVCSLDQYDKLSLPDESLVLFILSTTGAGDFPSSALAFWKFLLRAALPADVLDDVTFATFGLGDTSYARYCWPVRKLAKRLKALGAHQFVEGGEADDQHYLGIDGALHPWLETFFRTLDEALPLPAGVKPLPENELLPPRIAVRVLSNDEAQIATSSKASTSPALPEGTRWAKLTRNERMTTEDHWQDVRAIEWQAEDGSSIGQMAGDVASIKPENLPADVERLIEAAGWQEYADAMLELTSTDPDRPLPMDLPRHLTLRRLLTLHLDPFSVPRQSFFELIRHFAPAGHMEREKLDEFCTPGEGADDMYEYAQRVRRTIAEVLEEFRSVRVPVEWVCEVLPLLRNREFSIASSPAVHKDKVQLAVAMVEYKTRLKETRRGVCSRWLAQLPVGSRFTFLINAGTLRLPKDPATPIILVGPGTGVAPMRALVHEQLARSAQPNADHLLVFLGCRHSQKDWIYADEWRRLAGATGEPAKLTYRLATSREHAEKVYVQDKVAQEAERVWRMIGERGAYFYISGSSGKMPEGVRAAVEKACVVYGKMNEEEAEAYVNQMEAEGRWQEECWS